MSVRSRWRVRGRERVSGVQGGGGLAEVAADVDEVDQHRHLQAALRGAGPDRGDLLLVPVHQEDPLTDPERMSAVIEADTHLSRATGPGCALLRAGGAAMSSGSRTAGVKSATATISAIFLIPGCAVSALPAFLRCSGRRAMPLPSPCIMITSVSGRSSSASRARCS